MASYDTLESSVEDSRPIELYQFVIGADEYLFTSAEDTITIGGDDYLPATIARSKIDQGSDQATRDLTITLPATNALAQLYVKVPPSDSTTLNVFRYQRDEPAFATQILLFKGRVQNCIFPNDGTTADIHVRSIETALNTSVPRFTFMSMCNHVLYDDNCGAVASNFDFSGVVSDVTGRTVTIPGINGSGIDFVGGYIAPAGSGDFRTVLEQSGDVLTMLIPFAVNPNGTTTTVFAGCDHVLTGDCALVFNQVANFGGFNFVPNKAIFQTGI